MNVDADGAADGGRIGVFGGGLAGCCTALALAKRGFAVDLIEQADDVMCGASLHNEGKLHLGYVYAADRVGRTHELMARGSLSFPGILEHLTGTSAADLCRSAPFLYGVPRDSRLDVPAIAAHFERVDRTIRHVLADGLPFAPAVGPPPARRLSAAQERSRLGADAITAGFETGETSVDTGQVADLMRRAVRAADRVRLRLGCRILDASYADRGGVSVRCREGGGRGDEPGGAPIRLSYRYGVNCTWEDRLRLDASLGIRPPRPWIMRYKAALTLRLDRPVPADLVPSLTLVSGPYGDVVNHGGTRIFASWYPLCKLAESHDIDGAALHAAARAGRPSELARDSLEALARFVPGLAAVAREARSVEVGGGVIFAWGETDIDDPKSGLHERHAIGATLHRDWASIDTGKYCMAPYYAMDLAQNLARALPLD